jgi:hypothetical protein
MVRRDFRVIERAVTTFAAKPERLKRFGRSKDKTRTAKLARFFLRYDDSPVRKYSRADGRR